MARALPPPYDDEGPHALWHYSEDPGIEVFRPRRVQVSESDDELVWAIDTRHAPSFWFPRDCPRGTAWPGPRTTPEDLERFFGHTDSGRLHVIELGWVERVQQCELYAYRLPEETFEPHGVGGYWVSEATVEAREVVPVGDLLARHADAGIELRLTPNLWTWWLDVAGSSLEFSGSRLRNCALPMPQVPAAR
ncbi:MAG TPA: hypothetical protein VM933_07850 [Acidimicrobiales bacterium]|nr:hypothetical protein [Acidimicrobiales bacterium]